jgi:exodeoxyribonuclease-3
VLRGLPGEGPDAQKRVISATVDGLRIVNVYVPNGKAIDDPAFAFKLDWLGRLKGFVAAEREPALVLCGDFNIAPEDRDVHDPEAWRGRVHFSDEEHAALADLKSIGLCDLFRDFHEEGGQYSWWDYRQLGFAKNRGLRIDYFLGTEAARARTVDVAIDREERKGSKPSDHAPVTATFRKP